MKPLDKFAIRGGKHNVDTSQFRIKKKKKTLNRLLPIGNYTRADLSKIIKRANLSLNPFQMLSDIKYILIIFFIGNFFLDNFETHVWKIFCRNSTVLTAESFNPKYCRFLLCFSPQTD